ncbi:hypothetical protein [Kitasatospora indigofera]|uniref:hypothetical protein n=1 Tax=Kitasatospora indigofera TaxID=67307 RepID=UPI0036825B1A
MAARYLPGPRLAQFGLFAAQYAAGREGSVNARIADDFEQTYDLRRATAERVAAIILAAAAHDREQVGPELDQAVQDALQAGEDWAQDYVDSIRRTGHPAAGPDELRGPAQATADPIARHGDI